MVVPDLFITKIRFSVVANENEAVSAYDAVNELNAYEDVPCSEPVMLGAYNDDSSPADPDTMIFFQDGIFIFLF
jgi:hypothetical protein